MTHILRQIGFAAEQLEGGYKSYRQQVLQQLQMLPAQFSWRVLCGLTGSGKSMLLAALQQAGAQVLDLELIAHHRGSVLGNMPNEEQPTQKSFDSQVLAALQSFDATRPVYIESESKKIGLLRVPDALIEAMWLSPCLRLECAPAVRIELLRAEYVHFLQDPALIRQQLDRWQGKFSNELLAHWSTLCAEQHWDEFIAELLAIHYDPAYNKSIRSHYPNYDSAPRISLNSLSPDAFNALAQETLSLPLALSGNFVNNGNTI